MRQALILTLLTLLAGCAGRDGYAVTIDDRHQFDPSTLSVPLGSTVVFKNGSTVPQSVSADPARKNAVPYMQLPDGAAALMSGTLYPGETYRYTFTAPGTYVYISRYPENRYHDPEDDTPVGVVHVTDAATP